MYQVLARKWRPQTFEQLVGQPHVATTLANAIDSDRLAHAYIFAGLRGTGKTSVARILAKCLNCEQGPTTSPCGQCAACREIADGQAMDVMEIDAASRTKVEQTRELMELVSYAPSRDRYKILIIDEAHMLSKASFNALLKTLEEPPPNVLFVLATTELQKILPTILSRCQVFEFRRVTPRETAAHLRRLAEEEKITISDASLERIARAGEGSVRDALSVLERVLAFCGSEIGDDDLLNLLGSVRGETLAAMLGAMAGRDAASMLAVLDDLLNEGHDLVHFWGQLIAALRDLLLLRAVSDRPELLARPAEEARHLAEAAAGLGDQDLTRIFHAIAELEQPLKASSQPRYLFEAALVRIAHFGAVRPIEDVLASLESGGGAPPPSTPPGGGGGRRAKPAARRPADRPPTSPSRSASPTTETFLAEVQRLRPMLSALLDAASEVRTDGRSVAVSFPPGADAFRRQLDRADNRDLLGQCARAVFGTDVQIVLSSGPAETPSSAPAPAPAGPEAAARRRAPSREAGRDELIREANRDPGVRRLLREFGAQVVDIQPLAPAPGPHEDHPPEETGGLEDSP